MYQGRTQYTHNGLREKVVRRGNPAPDYDDFKDTRNTRNGASIESLDSEGEAKSFTRLLGRFADKTSMIGPPYIYKSKSWYAKVIWIILFLAGLGGMGIHLYYSTNQFVGFPKQTKIELGFSNLLFPAVTICNVNPIKTSKISLASEDLQSLLSELDFNSEDSSSGKRRKRSINDVNTSAIDDFEINYDYYGDDYEFGGILDETIKVVEYFRGLYRDEKRDTKVQMGHQLNESLISCTMGKYKCFASNFTLLQHDIYGNCYTLQSDTLKITKSGLDSGLTLVLYMDKEEYLKQLTEGYGARILIHDAKTFPFPTEEGLFIPSAMETQIGVKMILIERQDQPYGECVNGDDYEQKYGFKYTRSLCQFLCAQEKIYKACGCYEDDSSEINYQINKTNLKYCQTQPDVKCMLKEKAEQSKNKAECQCINPCKETQYVKTLSTRNWPTENYMLTLKDSVCFNLPSQCQDAEKLNNNPDTYQKSLNYLKVNIYYEDLNYENIKEAPEIETAQFASDVGGAIGLWIGLSLLSIFEVVQLCLECCAYAVHKCTNGNKRKNRRRKNKKSNETRASAYKINDGKHTSMPNSRDYNPQNISRYPGLYNGSYMYYPSDINA